MGDVGSERGIGRAEETGSCAVSHLGSALHDIDEGGCGIACGTLKFCKDGAKCGSATDVGLVFCSKA